MNAMDLKESVRKIPEIVFELLSGPVSVQAQLEAQLGEAAEKWKITESEPVTREGGTRFQIAEVNTWPRIGALKERAKVWPSGILASATMIPAFLEQFPVTDGGEPILFGGTVLQERGGGIVSEPYLMYVWASDSRRDRLLRWDIAPVRYCAGWRMLIECGY